MLMPNLKTEASRTEWKKQSRTNMEKLLADMRADKAANGGQFKMSRTPDRFRNSNPNGGGL